MNLSSMRASNPIIPPSEARSAPARTHAERPQAGLLLPQLDAARLRDLLHLLDHLATSRLRSQHPYPPSPASPS